MSVFKRGGNCYLYLTVKGRRYRKSLKTSSKKIALQIEADLKAKAAKGEYLGVLDEKRIVFKDFADEYLSFSKFNKSHNSYVRDTWSIKRLTQFFTDQYLYSITPKAIETYKNQRLDKVKPATVNRELACLRHMLNKATQWGYIRVSPMKGVQLLKEPAGRIRYLELDEIRKLLDNAAPYLKPIIVCALNTGMRKSEILGLKWRNVNLGSRVILVKQTKNNEPRAIPINGILYEELRNLPRYGDHVFAKPDGLPYRKIGTGFKAAVKRSGIRDFRFHDLRHTFASHLVMRGQGLQTVKELLGHKDIKMTMRYSHLSMTYKQEAVNELGAVMNLGPRRKSAPYTPQTGHSENDDHANR